VDHHLTGEKPQAAFVDVRRAYGASSSIYAEYLRDGLAPLTGQSREDSVVATALFFGIQTDTNDFSFATGADFAAAAYLRPNCDAEVLRQVGRQTVSAAAMDVVGRALTSLLVVRDVAVAGVGHVPVVDRDSIGTAAVV
jgi:nanoRNase/pAp phosphatase (c-di-AMP/oligoRNAs hydrolase)